MKAFTFILFLAICSIECRKTYKPIDKNANVDFINMESGGAKYGGNARPGQIPAQGPTVPVPAGPAPVPVGPVPTVSKPQTPKPVVTPITAKPIVPNQPPNQIKPVPVNPTPAAHPITTPGPGSVKQLVTFYDSQGKGSPIRPYTYSQAVKQG